MAGSVNGEHELPYAHAANLADIVATTGAIANTVAAANTTSIAAAADAIATAATSSAVRGHVHTSPAI